MKDKKISIDLDIEDLLGLILRTIIKIITLL